MTCLDAVKVAAGSRAMAAALERHAFMTKNEATAKANNIAAALQDGHERVERVVNVMVGREVENRSFDHRIAAVVAVRDAWLKATGQDNDHPMAAVAESLAEDDREMMHDYENAELAQGGAW